MRVIVISAFRFYREAVAALLREQREFEVIAVHGAVVEQSIVVDDAALNAVLIDARLIRHRSLIDGMRSSFPGALLVALGVSGTARETVRCTRAGVDGIVGHDTVPAEIAEVLTQIRRGEFPGASPVAVALFNHLAHGRGISSHVQTRLTPRERSVARLAARGLSNKRIAHELGLDVATVKNNMHNILRKTGLSRRSELAAHLLGRVT
jgi:DNA-binding NarL/FixJ family response regulator